MTYQEELALLKKAAEGNSALKPEGNIAQLFWDIDCYLKKNPNEDIFDAITQIMLNPENQNNQMPEVFWS